MNFREHLRRNWNNWLGIIGFVATIGSGLFSIYTYRESVKLREPAFVVAPERTRILNLRYLSKESSIKVIKRDGRQVSSDLTAVRFYFWNMGGDSIRSNSILERLNIKLSDPEAEIIDYQVISLSRDVAKIGLSTDKNEPTKKIYIDFKILEQNDGLTGQIIYEGSPEAELIISGVIEGVNKIQTSNSLQERQFRKEYLRSIKFSLIGLVLIGITALVVFYILKFAWSQLQNFEIIRRLNPVFDYSLFFLLPAMFVLILFISPIDEARKASKDNITNTVPLEISPIRELK